MSLVKPVYGYYIRFIKLRNLESNFQLQNVLNSVIFFCGRLQVAVVVGVEFLASGQKVERIKIKHIKIYLNISWNEKNIERRVFLILLLASSSCMYRVICEMTAIGFTMRRPDSMRSQMAALFLVTDSCLSYFICTLCSSYVEIRRLSYPSVKSVSHSCGEKGRVVHKIGFPPLPIHPDK